MRLILAALAVALMAPPAMAQDAPEEGPAYKFSFDIGPGFLMAVDDTADAAGVEVYVAAAIHPSRRFAIGVRVNATTIEGEVGAARIKGSPWGFGRFYMTGLEGGLRTYVEVAASALGTIAVRGGAEVGVAAGTAMFANVDGRKLSEEDAKDLIGLSGGMRIKF
jgi:hypothetical protein